MATPKKTGNIAIELSLKAGQLKAQLADAQRQIAQFAATAKTTLVNALGSIGSGKPLTIKVAAPTAATVTQAGVPTLAAMTKLHERALELDRAYEQRLRQAKERAHQQALVDDKRRTDTALKNAALAYDRAVQFEGKQGKAALAGMAKLHEQALIEDKRFLERRAAQKEAAQVRALAEDARRGRQILTPAQDAQRIDLRRRAAPLNLKDQEKRVKIRELTDSGSLFDRFRGSVASAADGIPLIGSAISSVIASAGPLGTIAASFTLIGTVAAGAAALVQKSTDAFVALTREGAKVSLIEQGFERLAIGAGKLPSSILRALEAGANGAVSTVGLKKLFSEITASGLRLQEQQLTTLVEGARRQGKKFGLEAEQAVALVVESIAKLQPRRLSQIGIAINLNDVKRKLADLNGVAVASITRQQTEAALADEVIKRLSNTLKTIGPESDDAALASYRFSAAQENVRNSIAAATVEMRGTKDALDILTTSTNQQGEATVALLRDIDKSENIGKFRSLITLLAGSIIDLTGIVARASLEVAGFFGLFQDRSTKQIADSVKLFGSLGTAAQQLLGSEQDLKAFDTYASRLVKLMQGGDIAGIVKLQTKIEADTSLSPSVQNTLTQAIGNAIDQADKIAEKVTSDRLIEIRVKRQITFQDANGFKASLLRLGREQVDEAYNAYQSTLSSLQQRLDQANKDGDTQRISTLTVASTLVGNQLEAIKARQAFLEDQAKSAGKAAGLAAKEANQATAELEDAAKAFDQGVRKSLETPKELVFGPTFDALNRAVDLLTKAGVKTGDIENAIQDGRAPEALDMIRKAFDDAAQAGKNFNATARTAVTSGLDRIAPSANVVGTLAPIIDKFQALAVNGFTGDERQAVEAVKAALQKAIAEIPGDLTKNEGLRTQLDALLKLLVDAADKAGKAAVTAFNDATSDKIDPAKLALEAAVVVTPNDVQKQVQAAQDLQAAAITRLAALADDATLNETERKKQIIALTKELTDAIEKEGNARERAAEKSAKGFEQTRQDIFRNNRNSPTKAIRASRDEIAKIDKEIAAQKALGATETEINALLRVRASYEGDITGAQFKQIEQAQQFYQALASTVDVALDLADALGLGSEALTTALGGAAKLGVSVGNVFSTVSGLKKSGISLGSIEGLGKLLPVAGQAVSTALSVGRAIASALGATKRAVNEREQKYIQSLDSLRKSIEGLDDTLRETSGKDKEEGRRRAQAVLDAAKDGRLGSRDITNIANKGAKDQRKALLGLAEELAAQGKITFGKKDNDDTKRARALEFLKGIPGAESYIALLQGDNPNIAAFLDGIAKLNAGFANGINVTTDFADALDDATRALSAQGITDEIAVVREAVNRIFAKPDGTAGSFSDAIKTLTSSDLGSPTGLADAQAAYKALLQAFLSGTANFGDLSQNDVQRLLEVFGGAIRARGGQADTAVGGSQNATEQVNGISSLQANSLLAYLGTQTRYQAELPIIREILSRFTGITSVPPAGTGVAPAGTPAEALTQLRQDPTKAIAQLGSTLRAPTPNSPDLGRLVQSLTGSLTTSVDNSMIDNSMEIVVHVTGGSSPAQAQAQGRALGRGILDELASETRNRQRARGAIVGGIKTVKVRLD